MTELKPDFSKYADGLVPAIIQDDQTQKVLMLGFMNAEALKQTQATGRVTFFSRSKQRLWTKGETSGHFLELKSITLDCDGDTLLIKVQPEGPVCHTGSDTCFGETNRKAHFVADLEDIIEERKTNREASSYVASLLNKGIHKVAQKVGEEAVEVVIEAMRDNEEDFKNEAADLLFHYLILLQARGYKLSDIEAVLAERHQGKLDGTYYHK